MCWLFLILKSTFLNKKKEINWKYDKNIYFIKFYYLYEEFKFKKKIKFFFTI